LFFVARQRPDILRHSSHVFLGAVLDSVRTVLLFLELFGCLMGMNVQTIRCLLQVSLLSIPDYRNLSQKAISVLVRMPTTYTFVSKDFLLLSKLNKKRELNQGR